MNFQEQFDATQNIIRGTKLAYIVKRALSIQARSKIKPNAMRPNMVEMSRLRGGDAMNLGAPLELYYPGQ